MNVKLASRTSIDEQFYLDSFNNIPDTQIAELIPEDITPEQIMVYVARGSSSRQNKWEAYEKLVNYLIKHKHWSPFQFAYFCFEIETSRAITLQMIRHASFDFQQLSQRYKNQSELEPVELRAKPDNNRQSSADRLALISADMYAHIQDVDTCLEQMQSARSAMRDDRTEVVNYFGYYYNYLALKLRLDQLTFEEAVSDEGGGVAGECARFLLPSCATSTVYMNGSVRSWLSFLNVRLDTHAQKEIRDIALEIAKTLAVEVPIIAEATNNFNDFKGNFM